jgi:hypothetical protein
VAEPRAQALTKGGTPPGCAVIRLGLALGAVIPQGGLENLALQPFPSRC